MKNKYNLTKGLIVLCFLMMTSVMLAQPVYNNKIPTPKMLDGSNGALIELDMQILNHKFDPNGSSDSLNGTGQVGIPAMCYNKVGETSNTYLGPTLFWRTGDSVNIRVNNLLPDSTTTHWHGAELPAKFDGGPHQPIAPGSSWSINIKNVDSTSTIWYHPHFHNTTFEQVQSGLSGMIISEQAVDAVRDSIPHTYGVDDYPIIIGDQSTTDTVTGSWQIYAKKSKKPINLVNGVTNPYLEAPAHLVRLRILNGSTRKGIEFGLAADTVTTALDTFLLVALDGGYTLKPDTMTSLLTGPGARSEIIVDLSGYGVGDSLYLRNFNDSLPGYIIGSTSASPTGGGADGTVGKAFFKIKIVSDSAAIANAGGVPYTPIDSFVPFVSPWTPDVADTNANNITNYRTKLLVKNPGPQNTGFSIDSTTFDMSVINDIVCVNTNEIWTIHNTSAIAHPFHIHKIFFRILSIQDTVGGAFLNLDSLGLNGPKDDILVRPYWIVRFMAAFDDYPNEIDAQLSYMYHCHILTHEDALGGGMMHQFVVTDEYPCTLEIDEEELSNGMLLYPNPATNELFLRGTSIDASTVRIIDIQGHIVSEQKLPAFVGNTPIDIDGLAKGFYVLQWSSVEGAKSKKLLLE